jgi:hypothetical protein
VVGSGSGPSAIYYNPANISEVKASSFSINASLFSFNFIQQKNALGDDIDLSDSKVKVEPRFLSYMLKSKKNPNWSFEVAFLNNENVETDFTRSVEERIDILSQEPGTERYFAYYQYGNKFRDDWLCAGASLQLNEHLYLGLGVFVIIKSLEYSTALNIEAYNTGDSVNIRNIQGGYAAAQTTENLSFNDYRISSKFGITYKQGLWSIGLCITSPSVGNIYSDAKEIAHKQTQINIYDPEAGAPVPDYSIIDYKEKKEMTISFKTPFSIAAGFTYHLKDGKRILYASAEYFAGLDPYRMVQADESADIASGSGFDDIIYTEWLTIVAGARPVFNVALGYSWTLKKDLFLRAGFRTDFNYQKNVDFGEFTGYPKIENVDLDLYYLTCGLSWNIRGQNLITGLQYSTGRTGNQKQIANITEPMEYSSVENLPLQGDPKNDMISLKNTITVYFGASINFGGEK